MHTGMIFNRIWKFATIHFLNSPVKPHKLYLVILFHVTCVTLCGLAEMISFSFFIRYKDKGICDVSVTRERQSHCVRFREGEKNAPFHHILTRIVNLLKQAVGNNTPCPLNHSGRKRVDFERSKK